MLQKFFKEYLSAYQARADLGMNETCIYFEFTDGTRPIYAFNSEQREWLYDCFLDALETMPEDED